MWQVGRVIGISSEVNVQALAMLQDWLFTRMYATDVKETLEEAE